MNLFRKLINRTTGRVIWIILIFATPLGSQLTFLSQVITAGFGWFVIDYLNEVSHSNSLRIKRLKVAILIGSILLFGVIIWLITEINSQTNEVILYRGQYDKLVSIETKTSEVNFQITLDGNQVNLYKDYLKLINEEQVVLNQYLSTQKNLQSKIFYKYIPEHKKAISVSINHTNNLIAQNEADIAWAQEAEKQKPDNSKLNNLLEEANKKASIADTSLVEQDKEAQGLEARINISHLWGLYTITPISMLVILLFGGSFLSSVRTKSKFISTPSFGLGVFNLLGIILLSAMIFL